MIEPDPPATRRVVFQYLVPVHVEVTPARRGKWYRLRLPDSYREPPLCFFVPSLPDS